MAKQVWTGTAGPVRAFTLGMWLRQSTDVPREWERGTGHTKVLRKLGKEH